MKSAVKIFLLLLIVGGICFRFSALDSHGFWLDEAWQFWLAKGVNAEKMDVVDHAPLETGILDLINNTHGKIAGSPTFTILLHYWSMAFNTIYWMRMIPCLFGVGALLLMYLIGRECRLSKKWSLLLSAFCAWNATWVYHSMELRPYSFEIFWSASALLFLLRIVARSNGSIRDWIGLGSAIVFGTTAGYGFFMFLPPLFCISILQILRYRKHDDRVKVKMVTLILSAGIIILNILYNRLYLLITSNAKAWYIKYLHDELGQGLIHYLGCVCRTVVITVKWQLFGKGKIELQRFPDGNPQLLFAVLASLFLGGMLYVLVKTVRRRHMEKGLIFCIILYSIISGVLLSTLGLAPFGPVRQNLFYSPAVITGFFICLEFFWHSLRRKHPEGVIRNILLLSLSAFLLLPNIYRDCITTTAARNDLRSLLVTIQDSVGEDDRIGVYANQGAISMLKYEQAYSKIAWVRKLELRDIYTGASLRSRIDRDYDSFWLLFHHMHSEQITRRNRTIKESVAKSSFFTVDKEYILPAGLAGFRVRRRE